MRIGIISDTHGLLRPAVFDVFAQVDHIVHAGDIGPVDLLTELEALAPVTAVYGNTDDWDIRHRVPQVATIELEGLEITVTHGDQFGSPNPTRLQREFPDSQVVVFGHTHMPVLELTDDHRTIVNPGAAGPRRFNVLPTVVVMDYEPVLPPRARLVELE